MTSSLKEPTHNRLIVAFKSVGPYVREERCVEGCYLFDCLSVCINDKKAPEEREFWGWWLDISVEEKTLKGKPNIGRYNSQGSWVVEKPDASVILEIQRTYDVFGEKMAKVLKKKFDLNIQLDAL